MIHFKIEMKDFPPYIILDDFNFEDKTSYFT